MADIDYRLYIQDEALFRSEIKFRSDLVYFRNVTYIGDTGFVYSNAAQKFIVIASYFLRTTAGMAPVWFAGMMPFSSRDTTCRNVVGLS